MSDLLAVVGTTASGKSDFALDLAEASGAEIISADAFQLYCGMDIGTAKVPPAQRRGIAHHQIDQLQVDQRASVAAYQRYARRDLAAIEARGHRVVVCGGSGLYVRALLDDFEFPGTDPQLRAAIEARAETIGAHGLHAQLRALDPQSAQRIPPENLRRVIRALEVCELTGRPFSATLPTFASARPTRYVALSWQPQALHERIERRTREMFAAGFVEEAASLQGLRESPTARAATGYAQALAVSDGVMTEEAAISEVVLLTARLAKRQLKWFRRDPRITWIDGSDEAAKRRLIRAWCEVS